MTVVSDATAITTLLKAGKNGSSKLSSGRITSVKSKIEMLQNRGGLYLSEEVIAEALKLAGE